MVGANISNILNIAKKEFSELMMNKFVIIVLAIFIMVLFTNLYRNYDTIIASKSDSGINVASFSMMGFLAYLIVALTGYGSLLGVAIGYSSISAEKKKGVLNTLISKPLYRDTVINGKLLGSIAFLFCVLLFASVIYTAGLLILYGNSFSVFLEDYLVRLPVVLLIALLYIMVFYSISLLFSVIIKDDIFSLFFSVLAWILIVDMYYSVAFIDSIAYLIIGSTANEISLSNSISSFFPGANLVNIIWYCSDYFNIIETNGIELLKLLLYVIIATILGYIAFIRSDIS
jgi:ABC-2 type transport system permease protein